MITLAATAHRPKYLAGAYELMNPINIQMGKRMRQFILDRAGYDEETHSFSSDESIRLISGMALGGDTVWAMVALKLKRDFPGKFILECAIPCKDQEKRWKKVDQERYHQILKEADTVTHISTNPYDNTCMYNRDKYMVDQADCIFGVCLGIPSGTKNTLDYAKKQGVECVIEDPTPWIEAYKTSKSVS